MNTSVSPLSYGQLALWHIQRLMPENPVYNVCLAWQVLSELDLVALKQTFQWLVNRHPSLRTTYFLRDREPFQIIHPTQKAHFKVYQASDWTNDEFEKEIAREVLRPFDLEKGPLMRTNMFIREEGGHIGLNCFHHIAVDMMSSSMLFDEIGTLYPAAKKRKPQPTPSPHGQYLDFVRWQREMLAGPAGKELWQYWKQQFPDKLQPFTLPFELERPVHPSFAGTSFPFKIKRNLTSRIESLSRKLHLTLYTFLLAGFQSLLHLYTGQNIFLIRTLTAGRNRPEFERVVGFYANPVVLKADFSKNVTFREVLTQTQRSVLLMFENQDFPFEYLMEKLSFGREIQYNPNPEIMFTLQAPQKFISAKKEQNLASANGIFAPGRTGVRLNLGGLVVEKYNPKQKVTLNDLALEMAQVGNELSGAIHYRTDLFIPRSISKMAENYQELLAFMVNNIDRNVAEFMPKNGFPKPVKKTERKEPFREAKRSHILVPQTHTAPRNQTEKKLIEILRDVLDVDRVGIFDDFFKLGGSSLQALQLMALVRDNFQVELPLQRLFDVRTIAGIAEAIDASESAPRRSPIERMKLQGKLPLSFSQERLWFVDQMVNGHIHNIPVALRIKGFLDHALMEKSLEAIVRRHETLRATFHSHEGKPYLKVLPSLKIKILQIDLSNHSQKKRETGARKYASEEAQKPFDLKNGPLIRITLLRLDENEHILLLTMHHIISDAWSLQIFFHELIVFYSALSEKKPSPLPELPIQYSDFAFWQKKWLQGEGLNKSVDYWKKRLNNLPILALPKDLPRPTVQTYRGNSLHFDLSKSLSRSLKALSEKNNATLFMTLLSAFKALLCRYTQQEDIVIGTPVAGRNLGEIKGLIGCFINILVLRTDLSGDPSFHELLNRVREEALAAYSHQELPFEKLVEILHPKREASGNPLFQVMFALQDAVFRSIELPEGLSLSEFRYPRDVAQYDLTLFISDTGPKLHGTVEYNTDLFRRETIEHFNRHFVRLLEGVVENPDSKLSNLPLLDKREKHKILVDWNDTQRDYPLDQCVHELFEKQVKRSPDSIALKFKDTGTAYRELDSKANQLANFLGLFKTKSDGLIGVYLEPSLEMVISLLAILKSGAAYVPLDPSSPIERTKLLIEDARLSLILTEKHFAPDLRGNSGPKKRSSTLRLVCLDEELDRISQQSASKPKHKTTPQNLAYVIYTSGSTGFPKGTKISHRALANYLHWCCETYKPDQGTGTPLHSSIAFDFSVTSLFAPLVVGQKVIISPRTSEESVLLSGFVSEPDWGMLKLTPLHAQILGDQISNKMESPTRTLVIGGEELKPEHLTSWLKYARNTVIYNEYGPTEATVGCSFYRIPKNIHKMTSLPIGRPIANMHCYILDKNLRPAPVGIPGELHIGGIGLAEGYLNHTELTAERFIPNPFSPDQKSLLFKSGDMARFLPTGDIEFLGRKDEQIKINGYRIEPGEIEATLVNHPAINKAVVISRENKKREKYLVAYLVGNKEKEKDEDIQSYLRIRLPSHMWPKAVIWLDAFPLTENGKMNRSALPMPDLIRPPLKQKYVPPENHLQKKLANLWSEVLGIDHVGIKDNFFDLGGHSLQALRLISLIRKTIKVDLPLISMFKAQTISDLASQIKEIREGTASAKGWHISRASLITLQSGVQAFPLFCFHPAGGGVSSYHSISKELEGIRPIYGIQSRAVANAQIEHSSIPSMAAEYADLIQQKQKKGPYFLLGWSFGGAVALSTASVLEKEGKKTAFLGLLDPWQPIVSHRLSGPSFFDLLMTIWKDLQAKERSSDAASYTKNFQQFKKFAVEFPTDPTESSTEKIIDRLSSQGLLQTKGAAEFIRQKLILGNLHVQLLEAFEPPVIHSPLHVWMPKSSGRREEENLKKSVPPWAKKGMITHPAEGDHFSMLLPLHSKKLAASILKSLLLTREGLSQSGEKIN